jgi:hypothetical protein
MFNEHQSVELSEWHRIEDELLRLTKRADEIWQQAWDHNDYWRGCPRGRDCGSEGGARSSEGATQRVGQRSGHRAWVPSELAPTARPAFFHCAGHDEAITMRAMRLA